MIASLMFLGGCILTPSESRIPETQVQFYVSPKGSDRDSGTRYLPFKTLVFARERIRAMVQGNALPKGGAVVFLREGTYPLPQGFVLDERDAGTAVAPVAYRAFKREEIRLVGGVVVDPTRFRAVTIDEEACARLSMEARENVVWLPLEDIGIPELKALPDTFRGGAPIPELFFGDEPMQLAKWPNEGWATIAKVIDRGVAPAGEVKTAASGKSAPGGVFVYSEDRPSSWDVARGVWLHGYWCHDWYDETIRIGAIDPKTKQITLAKRHGYGIGASHKWNHVPRRYRALNVLDELDLPGEYCIDAERRRLYFWPPRKLKKGRIVVSQCTEPVVSLKNTSHVILQGVVVEGTRGTGIRVRGGHDNLVAGCTVRNTAGAGITISGLRNGVTGCDIHSTGKDGISIAGGNRATLERGENYATNNHIHHFARLQRTYAGGIRLNGVGNRAANNLIHDCPHAGILYGGNDNTIERNEIFNTCLETGDVGALYTGRDWGTQGNVIRHNFIHHVGGVRGWSMGVYLDDCDSGDTIYGNIFYRVSRAVFIGGGRNNDVENNVFVDCAPAVHIDNRGKTRIEWNAGVQSSWDLEAKLKRYNYTKPPWSTHYPQLANIMQDQPALPKHNRIVNNLVVGHNQWLSVKGVNLENQTFEGNLILSEDPGFRDPETLDLQLRDDSLVWGKVPNFKRIPTEKIGLYEDPLRASWPVRMPSLSGGLAAPSSSQRP